MHCSCFQFRVSVLIHYCTNSYFTYRKLENNLPFKTFVGKVEGKTKNPWCGSGYVLLLPALSNFEICVALITVKLALGHSQYEKKSF